MSEKTEREWLRAALVPVGSALAGFGIALGVGASAGRAGLALALGAGLFGGGLLIFALLLAAGVRVAMRFGWRPRRRSVTEARESPRAHRWPFRTPKSWWWLVLNLAVLIAVGFWSKPAGAAFLGGYPLGAYLAFLAVQVLPQPEKTH